MTVVVEMFGLLIVAVGVVGLVSPPRLVELLSRLHPKVRLYAGAILRIVLGLALIVAASRSRLPQVLSILGIVSAVSGVALLAIRPERFESFVRWWFGRSHVFLRVWSVVAVAFGAFLVYVVL